MPRLCLLLRLVLLCAVAGAGTAAQAQLGLPRLPSRLPSLPPRLDRPLLPRPADLLPAVPLLELRTRTVRDLLRQHADELEADPAGEPVRRQELLLVSPSPALLDAALALGFSVLREQALEGLDLRSVVLRPPPGLSTAEALRRLRQLDPQLDADFNHLLTRSGELDTTASAPAPTPASGPAAAKARRIGLVDSGVDRQHAALRAADIRSWGCSSETPSPHGTAVASLLVGRDPPFVAPAAGATLFAADVYCGQDIGGSAETVAAALAWLAREHVAVISISLVGPANRLLQRAVQALQARGHLLVAAVGNDGPAAPPLFPAAYAGVVGVTGVNPERRVLPEAAQGRQVMLAAPGAELAAGVPGGGYRTVRGTSFAAPLVAATLAQSLAEPGLDAAAQALQRLTDSALDLGAPGRDPVYGFGLVAEQARIAPDRVHAASN